MKAVMVTGGRVNKKCVDVSRLRTFVREIVWQLFLKIERCHQPCNSPDRGGRKLGRSDKIILNGARGCRGDLQPLG